MNEKLLLEKEIKIFRCTIGDDFLVQLPLDEHNIELFTILLPLIKKHIERHTGKKIEDMLKEKRKDD